MPSRRGPLDEENLRQFLQTAYPRILANLALVTRDRGEAEDALQDALARAWARSESGEAIASLEAWVAVVALNLARSRLRRIGAERRATARLEGKLFLLPESTPSLDASRDSADLRAAISRLPRRQREIVFLHYYMDLAVGEAAHMLGIGEGTAKKALHRARQALAGSLQEPDDRYQAEEL